jgi:hypothetical protein
MAQRQQYFQDLLVTQVVLVCQCASSKGRLELAAGRVLRHTYQVEERERMPRVRYVRASRLHLWEAVRQARRCV